VYAVAAHGYGLERVKAYSRLTRHAPGA